MSDLSNYGYFGGDYSGDYGALIYASGGYIALPMGPINWPEGIANNDGTYNPGFGILLEQQGNEYYQPSGIGVFLDYESSENENLIIRRIFPSVDTSQPGFLCNLEYEKRHLYDPFQGIDEISGVVSETNQLFSNVPYPAEYLVLNSAMHPTQVSIGDMYTYTEQVAIVNLDIEEEYDYEFAGGIINIDLENNYVFCGGGQYWYNNRNILISNYVNRETKYALPLDYDQTVESKAEYLNYNDSKYSKFFGEYYDEINYLRSHTYGFEDGTDITRMHNVHTYNGKVYMFLPYNFRKTKDYVGFWLDENDKIYPANIEYTEENKTSAQNWSISFYGNPTWAYTQIDPFEYGSAHLFDSSWSIYAALYGNEYSEEGAGSTKKDVRFPSEYNNCFIAISLDSNGNIQEHNISIPENWQTKTYWEMKYDEETEQWREDGGWDFLDSWDENTPQEEIDEILDTYSFVDTLRTVKDENTTTPDRYYLYAWVIDSIDWNEEPSEYTIYPFYDSPSKYTQNYSNKMFFKYEIYTDNRDSEEGPRLDDFWERGMAYVDFSSMSVSVMQSLTYSSNDGDELKDHLDENILVNFDSDWDYKLGRGDVLHIHDNTGNMYLFGERFYDYDNEEYKFISKEYVFKINQGGSYEDITEKWNNSPFYYSETEDWINLVEGKIPVNTDKLYFYGNMYINTETNEIKASPFWLETGEYIEESGIVIGIAKEETESSGYYGNEGGITFIPNDPPEIVSFTIIKYVPNKPYYGSTEGVITKIPKRVYNLQTGLYENVE